MKDSIELSLSLPVSSARVYDAWLNSNEHEAFTGGGASIAPRVGCLYTAWDGYISGMIQELERPNRILHTWRTSEFGEEDADSLLEIRLNEEVNGGCTLNLLHTNLPKGEGKKYEQGWKEHYFEPMIAYFSK